MQTTISIDDKLFQEALHYADTDNPTKLMQLALHEFIHNHRSVKPWTQKRCLGLDKERFTVPDNFDEPDEDIEKAFYGT